MEHDFDGTIRSDSVLRPRPFLITDLGERRAERLGRALDDVVEAFVRLSGSSSAESDDARLRLAASARRLWTLARAAEPVADR
jgi:hypothetical protein